MGTVHGKSPTEESDSGLSTDEEDAAALLNKLVTVDRVHVEGLRRTKNDIIVPEVQKILEAQTFGEALGLAVEARSRLQELGIFRFVDLLVDTSSGPSSHPNGLDITIKVKEKRMLSGNAGTQVGNNEGSMVFGCILNNLFGRAESLKSNIGFGTRTKTSYQVKFDKPFPRDLDRSFSVGIQKSTTDFFQSSYNETSQGVNTEFMFPSALGQHVLGWDGTWREVTGLKKTASFMVREQAGHSLKSSLQHTFIYDERDDRVFPTEGSFVKLYQEAAGIGGDVCFLKHTFEFQENFEAFKDWILSWSLQGGILKPLRNQPSRINDRFFLGGPQSIRGYGMKGVGPRCEDDALGADAFWAAGLHLFTPLPFRPGEGGFGDRIRTHFFANAGNLVTLDFSQPWRNEFNYLKENTRWSYGAGLVFLLGVARVEVNYCVPGGAQSKDRINHGLQVGLGMNFL